MSELLGEYEGTWEEIAAHAHEFTGRRLRLVVLAEGSSALLSLEERRMLLRTPIDEQRRVLERQASELKEYYDTDTDWREFLEGDILDCREAES